MYSAEDLHRLMDSIKAIGENITNNYRTTDDLIIKQLEKNKSILTEVFGDAFDVNKSDNKGEQ